VAEVPGLPDGIATSSVGAASNIGTSLLEKVVNSRQVKELNTAFSRDKEIVEKLAGQVGRMEEFGGRRSAGELVEEAAGILGDHHLLLHILRGSLGVEEPSLTPSSSSTMVKEEEGSSYSLVEAPPSSTRTLLTQTSSDRMAYSPLDPGVLVESSKVIGQNSLKAAGQVVVGLSAAFMVWDAIDLGCSIGELVRREGSQAARLLRGRAALLETALQETLDKFSVRLPS